MTKVNFEIEKYKDIYKPQLLKVWEKAVLATHNFLKPEDFLSIKNYLEQFDFNVLEVYCLTQAEVVIGFIGISNKKIEMLFIDSDFFGIGLGKSLMDFAVNVLGADLVDVNEQNTNAVDFYKKRGFVVYERTYKDDQGRDYPLLRMKLL